MADTRLQVQSALKALAINPLKVAATELFKALGYASSKTVDLDGAPSTFLKFVDRDGRLLARRDAYFEKWQRVDFLFQLTNDEVPFLARGSGDLFGAQQQEYHTSIIESFVFLAIELPDEAWTRGALAGVTREVNRLFPMPAIVLFRHGSSASLGIVHRRLHKRDSNRDVLEKVTLIKDIALADPIRAHLEILNDFAFSNLDTDFGVSNFVRLHEAWQKRLGSYSLSSDFYREIADWYFWAHHQVKDGSIQLPTHCDTEQEKSLFLIRLLTRVIFCWFLVEKRLIPPELFHERRMQSLIRDFGPGQDASRPDASSSYYHAVLQNLFFGTLNSPSEQRAFRDKNADPNDASFGNTSAWRYEGDFSDPLEWRSIVSRVPFLNGGLFDCLDDKAEKTSENRILDGFSDNPRLACHLPNDLFFGRERYVDLSSDYGEEDKRTARSKRAKVRGLIEILSRYKFTIEENTPLEEEIALDPELLGKVFENLLASYNEDTRTTARKALGAFYTPREVVGYLVDEALKSYLEGKVPQSQSLLPSLFSNNMQPTDIPADMRAALVSAVGTVRIIDPACGSGAFPMGALHRLVDILKKLDPDNRLWRDLQRRRAIAETGQAFRAGDHQSREERLKEINDAFEFNSSDYGRKLFLIENGIYGVDIQPVAVQIAKLRFFISLIVDQSVEPNAVNLGVRPLPNLETRLVAADTLVPVEKDERSLFSGDVDKLRSELISIRHAHFNARSPSTKRKWREADEAKREQIANLLASSHLLSRDAAARLASWDPYDQNAAATFFDAEWMFGLPVGKVRIEADAPVTLLGNLALVNQAGGQGELTEVIGQEVDSGFDVVVGNPPYVRIQTIKKQNPALAGQLKAEYLSATKGNYDLYVVFIEAGLRLLRSDGHLAFICPSKFLNSDYGQPLRQLIAKGRNLSSLVHFGDQQVFPGASIYTCLLFLAKGGAANFRYVSAPDLEAWKTSGAGAEGTFSAESVGHGEWNFTVGRERVVFERMQGQGSTLEAVTARIFQGIKTSADKIYIVEERHRTPSAVTVFSHQTGKTHIVEPDLFHPLIKGGDSRAFLLKKTDRLILFPYAAVDDRGTELITKIHLQEKYPLTWAYLCANREALEEREDGKMRREGWYGYVYPKALDVMSLPKIFTPDLAPSASFALDESGELFFTGGVAGGYGLLPKQGIEPKWLLGLLNSRAVDFYQHQVATQMRGGWYSYESRFIRNLPIAEATRQQIDAVTNVVDLIISTRRSIAAESSDSGPRDLLMSAYWEQLLNALVYELYFPEDMLRAGLAHFNLIGDVSFPVAVDFDLAAVRRTFEIIYDGRHPVRVALDKLQTLDIVRVIEGNA